MNTTRTASTVHGAAVLGCGIMGRRMIRAMQAHPRWRIAGLWDPSAAARAEAAALAPEAAVAADARALAADPAVALVHVASPPAQHLAGVRSAFAAGRAVLCEKPLAASEAEARALRDLAAASPLPLAVNFPFAAGAARQLADAVATGRLGRVREAAITLRFAQWPRPWQAGAGDWLAGAAEGGFTREVLSHFVFLAQRLFGPATVIDATLTRPPEGAETGLQARLRHGGLTLTVDAAVAGEVADHNRLALRGDRGRAALVDWGRLEHDGVLAGLPPPGPALLDRLAAMVDGAPDHGLASADEALDVVRVVETLLGTAPAAT